MTRGFDSGCFGEISIRKSGTSIVTSVETATSWTTDASTSIFAPSCKATMYAASQSLRLGYNHKESQATLMIIWLMYRARCNLVLGCPGTFALPGQMHQAKFHHESTGSHRWLPRWCFGRHQAGLEVPSMFQSMAIKITCSKLVISN